MGIHVIRVPDIGEGIAEVELVAWHVKPGETVAAEQGLADVMTDKANVEIPSHVAGKVLSLNGKPGDKLAVGSELIRLEVEGAGNVKGEAPPSAAAKSAPQPVSAKPAPAAEPAPSPAGTPARRAVASRRPGEKPIASPAVRRHAWDLGVDLRLVHGSGPAGRILHEDVDAHAASGQAAPVPAVASGVERHGEEVVPVIGLRRKIAEKMQESKRHIPHYTYVEEVDVTELEALRAQLNARHEADRGRLTLLPFLMRAIARAAPEFPEVNARYDDEAGQLTRYGAVHIGIATQTDNGLVVPVVRHAEARDLWSCAAQIARLAEAARAGKAQREELTGSTITITSLGPLGGIVTTPVINHPEVAIVGVNRVVERPVIRNGAVVPRLVMNLSSSFDHRIVDGMRAAQFVQALRGFLEAPATLFID
ncbi:MAG TPA: dihydrolipoamide acetyltransferase family protein [Usitatibacter sp.]|nr:dihydrolipoamide acetyltransferase family protein [Usitatibacter sp.]